MTGGAAAPAMGLALGPAVVGFMKDSIETMHQMANDDGEWAVYADDKHRQQTSSVLIMGQLGNCSVLVFLQLAAFRPSHSWASLATMPYTGTLYLANLENCNDRKLWYISEFDILGNEGSPQAVIRKIM